MRDITKMPKYFFNKDFIQYAELFLQHGVRCEFHAKDVISSQGDTLKNGFYIKKGIMQIAIGNEIGKEKTIAFMGEGSIFPIGINEHRYKIEYAIVEKAFTDVVAYKLEYNILKKIVLEYPELALSIIEHYCDFTSFLFYEISSLSYNSIHTKICSFLYLFICYGPYKNNTIELNQDDIASIIGASRVQIARIFRDLRKKGIIMTYRNCVKVLDLQKLSHLCSVDVLKDK